MSDDFHFVEVPFADRAHRIANATAAEATTAYLVGRGLVAEIDDLRVAGDSPMAAPGLEELVARLEHEVGESCNHADRVVALLDGPDNGSLHDDIAHAIDALTAAKATACLATRRLAQLMLGLSSQLAWSDAIARAERAAVVALHPFQLLDDGLELHAESDDELLTELCGALCRTIIDHDCELDLRVGDAVVQLRIDAVGNLIAVVASRPDRADRLVELGWGLDRDGFGAVSWDDPLPVVEPAHLAIETLRLLAGEPVATRLTAIVRPSAG